jgi:hypothetical protein
MDHEIFLKLPSGGTLWKYQHEHAEKYIQTYYEQSHQQKAIYQTTQTTFKVQQNVRRQQTFIEFIIHNIDDMGALYTQNIYTHVEKVFREKMTDCITTGPIPKWLGPKKTRYLLGWMSRNNIGEIHEMGKIICDFFSWFLNCKFKYIHEKSRESEKTPDSIYVIYDKKMFYIKN